MSGLAIGAAVTGTALVGIAAGFTAGTYTLFNRTIPRQDQLRVDISEMADMDKWEEYKKFIVPNREWLEKQPLEHVTITSYDGLTLCAEYFPADTPSERARNNQPRLYRLRNEGQYFTLGVLPQAGV